MAPLSLVRFLALCLLCACSLRDGSSLVSAETIQGKVQVPGARDSRGAVVYVDRIPGRRFDPPRQPVVLDQLNLRFVPHVLPVLVGTTVSFPNSDEVRHNVFSPSKGSRFDLGTYPMGSVRQRVFSSPGVVTVLCNVHAEMSAYVVVTETPYYAVTDPNGRFTIAGVPPGVYSLRVWHERVKPSAVEVRVDPGTGATVTLAVGR